jgi:hypothetical protein
MPKIGLNYFKWNVKESSTIAQVLHMTASFAIKGMEQRIVPVIEFRRFQSNSFTKRLIEYRRRLDPPPVDAEVGARMSEEDIGPSAFA